MGDRLPDDLMVHRIGGTAIDIFQPKEKELALQPPGISVLLGGTPEKAARQLVDAFPDRRKYSFLHNMAKKVGTASVGEIRRTGFDVIANPTTRFSNHGRIIHLRGREGFSAEGLVQLAKVFVETAL
jgi:hypothetical protein